MNIENIAELAERIYFTVLSELSYEDIKQFIVSDGDVGTKNTERGTELYMSIEESIKEYMEGLCQQ